METNENSQFDASSSALGYYYQGMVALLQLFDSQNDDCSVSLETWDDVTLEEGGIFKLLQLKHSINPSTKVTIKSTEIWKTLRIWSTIMKRGAIEKVLFFLMTVASIDENGPLNELNFEEGRSRQNLIKELSKEAQRVLDARKEAPIKDSKKLPYEEKYKGCKEFLSLNEKQKKELIHSITLLSDSAPIKDTENEIIFYLKTTPPGMQNMLTGEIISWWQKRIIDSLISDTKRTIHKLELQEFIANKIMELNRDGFTDDSEFLPIPSTLSTHYIQEQQLDIINAPRTLRKRSYDTEVLARLQREKWISDSISAAAKLEKYDTLLTKEWSYKFGEIEDVKDQLDEEKLKEEGRKLLKWTFEDAPQRMKPLSVGYNNPDLVRGSFQMLSKNLVIGWHCNYLSLIDPNEK
ncbi:ABC-three component system protein [Sphingobacterium sp. BS-2]|uniref:ABC-three component system protein n=1 Tax=Sphingobacterium sp. BS-2 TaxID=3377129 RepID=UPI0038FC4119